MPRRRNDNNTLIEIQEDTLLNDLFSRSNIVSNYLAGNYYDLLKQTNKEIVCPICMEEICCKKCFTLLRCGHYCCLYEYIRINKCPICRET